MERIHVVLSPEPTQVRMLARADGQDLMKLIDPRDLKLLDLIEI